MALTANQRLCKQPSETRKFEMDFSSVLSTSENISSIFLELKKIKQIF